MTTWLDPDLTPEPGTECADGSRLQMTDEVLRPGRNCPYCNHPNCYPQVPCMLCQHEIRIRHIERTYRP